MLQRFALGLEYDGSVFYGFQRQKSVNTVQAALEEALSKFSDQPIMVIAAGRTDAKVHARGQVVHFDTTAVRDHKLWCTGVNNHLDPAIRILWVRSVPQDFHARNQAIARVYRYFIYNHISRPSLFRDYVTWHRYPLNIEWMQQAACAWLGKQDFAAFQAGGCQSFSSIRTLYDIHITRLGDLISIKIKGNAFLQHMIRNMMGVLLPIGDGRAPIEWAGQVLESRDRQKAGETSCAKGLYLDAIYYPKAYNIPVLEPSLNPVSLKI